MPRMGTPSSKTAGSTCGASSLYCSHVRLFRGSLEDESPESPYHAVRTAAENDADGLEGKIGNLGGAWEHFAVDVQLSQASRYLCLASVVPSPRPSLHDPSYQVRELTDHIESAVGVRDGDGAGDARAKVQSQNGIERLVRRIRS